MANIKKTLLLFTFIVASSNLFGAYVVKLAVYKNYTNLMTVIAKIPDERYRKNIVIEKKDDYHYLTSTRYESKTEAKKALGSYRIAFSDAFIIKVKEQEQNIVSAPEDVVVPTPVNPNVIGLVKKRPASSLDVKHLLENKTVYVCDAKGSKKTQKQIIKVKFEKESVSYTKLSTQIYTIDVPYIFDRNCVILSRSAIHFRYQTHTEKYDFLSPKSFMNNSDDRAFQFDSKIKTQHLDQNQNQVYQNFV
ncbi:MAG: SPOR domain-containing protein [Sulfurovum sp.]|nr:SPOR domain-containing protein [Sulfurovum sp.]